MKSSIIGRPLRVNPQEGPPLSESKPQGSGQINESPAAGAFAHDHEFQAVRPVRNGANRARRTSGLAQPRKEVLHFPLQRNGMAAQVPRRKQHMAGGLTVFRRRVA